MTPAMCCRGNASGVPLVLAKPVLALMKRVYLPIPKHVKLKGKQVQAEAE